MNTYVGEFFRSENMYSSTKIIRAIIDAKYEKSGLNNVMKEQCQHITEDQWKYLLELLQKFKFFCITLGICKTDRIYFKLK